jgi:dTDP-4-amino-4,6-dideoxygalactose transaminase
MKIPFLDLKAQYNSIKEEIHPAIENVLDNTAYILGKPVFDFEDAFANAHNVKHVLAVSSGTDGNHMALWGLGIRPGDEIIMPANTFIATAWGATLCGAVPVFVDCEEDSYNIDPAKIEAAITPKTKAIVAVHLYGQPADMDRLKAVAEKHNLFLVEDAAQSHLAEYKGNKIGGLGDAASFSFYPGKNLGAYGEGGAVSTNNDELALTFKKIRDHGALQKYYHDIHGHNYRMDGIQGAVLGVKMRYIEAWTEARRSAARNYGAALADLSEIILPREMAYSKHVYHLYVIQVNSGSRDELAKYLSEHEIATGLHYPVPLHLQKCFSDLNYKKGDFPVTEYLADNILSLPMYPELTELHIEYVADKIKSFFKKDRKIKPDRSELSTQNV